MNSRLSPGDHIIYNKLEGCVFNQTNQTSHDVPFIFQNASDQKTEMEKIKGKMAQEVSKIEERKAKIDDELKEVQVSWLCPERSDHKGNNNQFVYSDLTLKCALNGSLVIRSHFCALHANNHQSVKTKLCCFTQSDFTDESNDNVTVRKILPIRKHYHSLYFGHWVMICFIDAEDVSRVGGPSYCMWPSTHLRSHC